MTIAQLSEVVKNELNAQPWSSTFQAARKYKPVYDLEDIHEDGVQVDVVPREYEPADNTRGARWRTDLIDISIIKKTQEALDDKTEKDALMALSEAITKHFARIDLNGSICLKSVYNPLYIPEKLQHAKVFFGLIMLSFRGIE